MTMSIEQCLLTCLAEELGETAHEALKAARFGVRNSYGNPLKLNEERIVNEFHDVLAVLYLLQDMEIINVIRPDTEKIKQKKRKLIKIMQEQGYAI